MWIAFTTNQWHEHASKNAIAISKSKMKLIKKIHKIYALTEYDFNSLIDINQTQNRDINFILEEMQEEIICK